MATGAGYTFLPVDPAPAVLATPLIDVTGTVANPGTGGNTAAEGRMRGPTDVALGREVIIEDVDSPGQGYRRVHPGFPMIPDGMGGMVPSRLTRVRFNLTFGAFLSFWTNATARPGATGDAADRLYSVLLEQPWQVRAVWTIDATGAPTAVGAPTITAGAAVTRNPLARASATSVEVRPPTGLSLLATDAQRRAAFATAHVPGGPHRHISGRPLDAVPAATSVEPRILARHLPLHHLVKRSAPLRVV
jgi:hypothetical protein